MWTTDGFNFQRPYIERKLFTQINGPRIMTNKKRDQRLSPHQAIRISHARVLVRNRGNNIKFTDATLAKLISFIAFDVDKLDQLTLLPDEFKSYQDYYEVEPGWIDDVIPVFDFTGIYLEASQVIPEFETAFVCMCEIHNRRTKFEKIKQLQNMPSIEKISLHTFLEYGTMPNKALGAYLVLRKFIYDIDNRSAQETGYLFESILANALGGQPYSAKESPITHHDDDESGRQIDCIVDDTAYEFKLRVTETSRGRARFEDELQLPHDCASCGYTPILIVLDDTPSSKSAELISAYEAAGGMAHTGAAAWDYIGREAGPTMSIFIDKYVRQPLERVSEDFGQVEAFSVFFEAEEMNFTLKLQDDEAAHKWSVARPAV